MLDHREKDLSSEIRSDMHHVRFWVETPEQQFLAVTHTSTRKARALSQLKPRHIPRVSSIKRVWRKFLFLNQALNSGSGGQISMNKM
jgi:hypothetical protein